MGILANQGSASQGADNAPWGDRGDAPTQRRGFSSPRRRALWIGALLATASLLFLSGRRLGWVESQTTTGIQSVLPGEFQNCQGLLLAPPPAEVAQARLDVLVDVIAHVRHYVPVYVLVRDEEHRRAWIDQMRRGNVSEGDVRFLQIPFNVAWVRDYGPLVVKSFQGGSEVLDFDYAMRHVESALKRDLDDAVPSEVAAALGARAIKVQLALDGGNLLSNGAGLCLTTSASRAANPDKTWEEVCDIVRQYLGGQQLVALEPLADEPTGHLDMFCTFAAADTVVIAECDPAAEPENAKILDANARLLAEVRTSCGPLHVVRIPMPPRRGKDQWLSYTNVIYANGLLLVPSYPGSAPDLEEQALATYRRLLPNWHIVSINALPLVEQHGSLHCVTMNLGGMDLNTRAVAMKAMSPPLGIDPRQVVTDAVAQP